MGELRSRAQEAKQRLKNGFWLGESQKINEMKNQGTVAYNQYIKNLKTKIYACKDSECLVEQKVLELILGGIANPLPHVIDQEYFETLSACGRARYIMQLGKIIQTQRDNIALGIA